MHVERFLQRTMEEQHPKAFGVIGLWNAYNQGNSSQFTVGLKAVTSAQQNTHLIKLF